jgi:Leucine-rich repeat (LRR) protein
MKENIKELLLSVDIDSQNLGYELSKSLGFYEELIGQHIGIFGNTDQDILNLYKNKKLRITGSPDIIDIDTNPIEFDFITLLVLSNVIVNFDKFFDNLKKLQKIEALNCALSLSNFEKIDTVREIIIEKSQLFGATSGNINFKNLDYFAIYHCALPKNFFDYLLNNEFPNIVHFTIFGSEVYKIPKKLSKLKNLEILYIGETDLSYDDFDFKVLENLIVLNLFDVRIYEINKTIENTNLKELYLSNNPIFNTDFDFGTLQKLEVLHLDNTKLKKIPKGIETLKNLKTLNLNGCDILTNDILELGNILTNTQIIA